MITELKQVLREAEEETDPGPRVLPARARPRQAASRGGQDGRGGSRTQFVNVPDARLAFATDFVRLESATGNQCGPGS